MTIEIPLMIFLGANVIGFISTYFSFRDYELWNIVCSLLSVTLFFWMSKVIINGTLVQSFGGVSSADVIVTGDAIITNASLSYFYLMMAIIMFGVMIMNLYVEYQERTSEALEGY